MLLKYTSALAWHFCRISLFSGYDPINPSLEQNTVVSLVELRGVAYALHLVGSLLIKNGSEIPVAMMVLPADRIVTDSLNLYYANGASLFELDVVTGTSTEVWHADTDV
jgi:hypothetical protein